MNDLVIRGATVVDGLGNDPRRADVAVKDGRIAAIGEIKDAGARTIDAGGLTLSPGIVDVHTHYDAQVTWDATLSPSPSLGVTTAVMGNCGFGIVPAPAAARDLVIRNLSVVEGLCDKITVLTRGKVLAEGTYETVSKNPDVIAAYLGTADA